VIYLLSHSTFLLNRTRHYTTWIEILDKYLEVWEKRPGGLDPSDQAVPGPQTRLESAIQARSRLVEIRDEVVRVTLLLSVSGGE